MAGHRDQFESIDRTLVPHTRKSKHHELIEKILSEVETLRSKKALRIPRSAFGAAKIENVRAALSRASARQNVELATSSDEEFFYVWRQN